MKEVICMAIELSLLVEKIMAGGEVPLKVRSKDENALMDLKKNLLRMSPEVFTHVSGVEILGDNTSQLSIQVRVAKAAHWVRPRLVEVLHKDTFDFEIPQPT